MVWHNGTKHKTMLCNSTLCKVKEEKGREGKRREGKGREGEGGREEASKQASGIKKSGNYGIKEARKGHPFVVHVIVAGVLAVWEPGARPKASNRSASMRGIFQPAAGVGLNLVAEGLRDSNRSACGQLVLPVKEWQDI